MLVAFTGRSKGDRYGWMNLAPNRDFGRLWTKDRCSGERGRTHDLQICFNVDMQDARTHGHDSDGRHG